MLRLTSLFISTTIMIFVLYTGAGVIETTHAASGKQAHSFVLKNAKGSKISLKNYRGKVVYLDFWASWCVPCRESFPWMRKMQSQYKKKGLRVIAVNLDKDKKLAAQFLKENKSNFEILYDSKGKVAEKYNVVAMPSSYLIDRRGRIRAVHHGFREEVKEKAEADIKKLLRK
ncbi:MAG: TlpA family protein disulfide reductase [Gammaproteobacteria bacterium]|nr:TlpA family protein disulfide reductase [Gammaproteobacteria bacterium]MDH5730325.1 TlpA family protein disulfide reductase [Gammaproteobacteria bacterium]